MTPDRPRPTEASALPDPAAKGARPAVAVVIPARDAAATLPATLAALARSTHPHEVVVVDDGSTDATGALAAAAGARVVRLRRPGGPAAARNAGVAATDAALLAFTDADCAPAPGWLAALVAGLEEADLVTGPVLPDPAVAPGRWDRTLNITQPSPLFETANLGLRRSAWELVGGFAPFAPAPGAPPGLRPRVEQGHFGEDAVLGWRARRAGATSAWAPGAVVHHAVVARGPRAFVAERWRLRFFPALAREVPELRSGLPLGTFLSARTARVDLAAAGVVAALALRRPAPLLALTPYARLLSRDGAGPRGSLVLLTADLVGLAALVRGSVAARRPLL